MYEMIIVMTDVDEVDGQSIPITHVRRIEFETKEQMHESVIFLSQLPGVVNSEFLEGESMR